MKINPIDSFGTVKALLTTCNLPIIDISSPCPPLFFGIGIDDELVAIVGMELLEGGGLLR